MVEQLHHKKSNKALTCSCIASVRLQYGIRSSDHFCYYSITIFHPSAILLWYINSMVCHVIKALARARLTLMVTYMFSSNFTKKTWAPWMDDILKTSMSLSSDPEFGSLVVEMPTEGENVLSSSISEPNRQSHCRIFKKKKSNLIQTKSQFIISSISKQTWGNIACQQTSLPAWVKPKLLPLLLRFGITICSARHGRFLSLH